MDVIIHDYQLKLIINECGSGNSLLPTKYYI